MPFGSGGGEGAATPHGTKALSRQRHRQGQSLTWPAPSGRPVVAAVRTDTFLGERYRHLARRRGKKKVIVAVARSILIIIRHLPANPADGHGGPPVLLLVHLVP
jgi:hypothetical protein